MVSQMILSCNLWNICHHIETSAHCLKVPKEYCTKVNIPNTWACNGRYHVHEEKVLGTRWSTYGLLSLE
jgi:hypothetical protein